MHEEALQITEQRREVKGKRERGSYTPQTVKNLPTMQRIQVQSLGWEEPLDKGIATHSSILSWGIPLTEEPGGLQSRGSQTKHD